ncbi:MAG TPA: sugar transferase [Microbacterium sp.]|nr:sugar transferase [Microbacterium sp.]
MTSRSTTNSAAAKRQSKATAIEHHVTWRTTRDRPLPLVLRQRAYRNMRGHATRSVLRIGSLLIGDAIMLVLAHRMLRVVGDARWFGSAAGDIVRTIVPPNTFNPLEVFAGIIVGLFVFGTYGQGDHRRDPTTMLFGIATGLALNWWHVMWTRPSAYLVLGFAIAALATWMMVMGSRLLLDQVVRRMRPHSLWTERVLVVGTPEHARRLLLSSFCDGTEVNAVGYLDVAAIPADDALGPAHTFPQALRELDVDTVVITGGITDGTVVKFVDMADAAGCQVYMMPTYFNAPGIEPGVTWRGGHALVQITRPGTQSQQLFLKRVFDVIVASMMLVVLSPVMITIAAILKVTSRGPVFFRQTRIGRGGRRFSMWKFRSMVTDAEERRSELTDVSLYRDPRLFKVKNDPRVTPFGAFLRRTSLDELPQLWNVLRGEMSLVGPRPPVPSEVELYAEHHYTRFDVRPGMTGPWQVSGRNNITSFEQVIELETAYIRHWTLWKDFSILLQTVPTVVKMDGAH